MSEQLQTLAANSKPMYSYDPIIEELHMQRAAEWDRFGNNSQAWFESVFGVNAFCKPSVSLSSPQPHPFTPLASSPQH